MHPSDTLAAIETIQARESAADARLHIIYRDCVRRYCRFLATDAAGLASYARLLAPRRAATARPQTRRE